MRRKANSCYCYVPHNICYCYGQCPSYPIYNLETHLGGIDYPFIPLVSITHLEKKIDTKGWLMKRLRLALIATKNTYVIHIACDEINNDKCQ